MFHAADGIWRKISDKFYKTGRKLYMNTVFVVDDSITNLFVAKNALCSEYSVYTMSSAEIMFNRLEKITPNLILLDIDMPVMNGLTAFEKLKSTKWAGIPVIFHSASDNETYEVTGLGLGAVDFIAKPCSKSVLLSRVKNHI